MSLDTFNRAKRLAGPANIASGTSTIFTGTASHDYTVRSIRIVNNTSAPITVKLGIGGVTDALLILPAIVIPAFDLYHEECLFILTGTDTLQANASASGLTITVCGLDQS
jgi:hypothetical protein